jgi:hypothetical protein
MIRTQVSESQCEHFGRETLPPTRRAFGAALALARAPGAWDGFARAKWAKTPAMQRSMGD